MDVWDTINRTGSTPEDSIAYYISTSPEINLFCAGIAALSFLALQY
jgi:hypothetical protein